MQPQNSPQDGGTNATGLILIGLGTILFFLGVAIGQTNLSQATLLVIFGGSLQIAGWLIRSIRPRPKPDPPEVWYSIYNPNDIGASTATNPDRNRGIRETRRE